MVLVLEPLSDYVARDVRQRWPGGWGITADDVVAALYTCGVLHAIHWLAGLQAHAPSL